jgi:hypothetical protein
MAFISFRVYSQGSTVWCIATIITTTFSWTLYDTAHKRNLAKLTVGIMYFILQRSDI